MLRRAQYEYFASLGNRSEDDVQRLEMFFLRQRPYRFEFRTQKPQSISCGFRQLRCFRPVRIQTGALVSLYSGSPGVKRYQQAGLTMAINDFMRVDPRGENAQPGRIQRGKSGFKVCRPITELAQNSHPLGADPFDGIT